MKYVTAYTTWQAEILCRAKVDGILVGDSVGMVEYGESDTRGVSLDMMIRHGRAVVRGVENVLGSSVSNWPELMIDVPFGSYSMDAVTRLVKESGIEVVKVEGEAEFVRELVEAGFRVMGHTGLKPQTAEKYGFVGRDLESFDAVLSEAVALSEAGVESLILECVGEDLAAAVLDNVKVPVIGIGASEKCHGQILVFHDVVGLYAKENPSFAKKFVSGCEVLEDGVRGFVED